MYATRIEQSDRFPLSYYTDSNEPERVMEIDKHSTVSGRLEKSHREENAALQRLTFWPLQLRPTLSYCMDREERQTAT